MSIMKGATWLAVSKITTQVLTFVVNIYIANLLLPADFALMGIGMSAILLMDYITDSGFGSVIIQREKVDSRDLNCIFFFTFGISCVLVALLFLFANTIEQFFNKTGAADVLLALSSSVVIKSLCIVPAKLIEREQLYHLRAKVDLIARLSSLTLSFVLALYGFGVWALVFGQIANAIAMFVSVYWYKPYRPQFEFNLGNFGSILHFSGMVFFLQIVWYARNNVDLLIAGKYLNKDDFGVYVLAFQLSRNLFDTIRYVQGIITFSSLSRLQKNALLFSEKLTLISKYSFLVAAPIFFGGALCSQEIVGILLAPKWQMVAPVLSVACVIQFFRIASSISDDLFLSLGKPMLPFVANLLIVAAIGVTLYAASGRGLLAFTSAWLQVFPAAAVFWLLCGILYIGLPATTYLRSIFPPLVSAGAMAIIVHLVKQTNFALLLGDLTYLILLVVVGSMAYVGSLLFIDKKAVTALFYRKKTQASR